MKFNFYIPVVLCGLSSFGSMAQASYKPSYALLKSYEGTYEFASQKTLQIAASPVDSVLYALIGDSRYRLRPFAEDIFLNNANVQVKFIRKETELTGYTQQNEKPGTFHKLISHTVSFSEKMWVAREDKNFSYHYKVPEQKNDGLATASLVNSGLDTALIHTLINRIVDGTYPGVHSILLIKNNKLVLEEYFYEYDAGKLHELRSASKSFTSALTGIAIDKGMIKDINSSMIGYLPGYSVPPKDSAKRAISIENLLTQQTGLACSDFDQQSPGNEVKMYPTSDWIKFMLNLPMTGKPGQEAFYCSGNVMLLDRIVENASQLSLHNFAAKYLFTPLGITDFKWEFVPDSTHADDYGQVMLTPRDMAKFGMLYLNKGQWNGQQIISSSYVNASLSKHSVLDGLNYGYLWWCEDLTANGFTYRGMAAKGNGGQRIFIWPDQNMVAIVTAGNYNTHSPANKLLIECVLGGLSKH